jgi:hypothetical protein
MEFSRLSCLIPALNISGVKWPIYRHDSEKVHNYLQIQSMLIFLPQFRDSVSYYRKNRSAESQMLQSESPPNPGGLDLD